MSDIAIRVDRLCKQYMIGRAPDRAANLQEALLRTFTGPFRRQLKGGEADGAELLWALRDISFELPQGEVLGVIGRNGAGKSTLLKVLSRITAPTSGEVELHGRLASLLEVGTGFHPELTGRENVYLNGAMLGMRRGEIARKFDEIVDFSGVERFLDTPVKRYSSGMYTRLAFAVAAHLDPEILVVDEVLAVGDASFQRKCLGKMGEVAKTGRTVLFVSHQLNSIRRLCTRCLWLDAGQVRAMGSPGEVIGRYEANSNSLDESQYTQSSNQHAQFLGWELAGNSDSGHVLYSDVDVRLRIHLRVEKPIRHGHHGITLRGSDGRILWGWSISRLELEPGIHELQYDLSSLPLRPGSYQWHASLYEDQELLDSYYATPEMIIATEPLGHHLDEWAGILNIPFNFAVANPAEIGHSKARDGVVNQPVVSAT